jgi:hypothetical protein
MDDDGSAYLCFGTFNYYIAKLNPCAPPRPTAAFAHWLAPWQHAAFFWIVTAVPGASRDLISLAEKPRGVKILKEQHRDDKPFMHKHDGRYYLSWGCWVSCSAGCWGGLY